MFKKYFPGLLIGYRQVISPRMLEAGLDVIEYTERHTAHHVGNEVANQIMNNKDDFIIDDVEMVEDSMIYGGGKVIRCQGIYMSMEDANKIVSLVNDLLDTKDKHYIDWILKKHNLERRL